MRCDIAIVLHVIINYYSRKGYFSRGSKELEVGKKLLEAMQMIIDDDLQSRARVQGVQEVQSNLRL